MKFVAFAFAAAFLPVMAVAQVTPAVPGQPEARTALELMPTKGRLTVTSPAFREGEQIPFEYTAYRTNTFPGLNWSPGPVATKSYVIIMQDNSALLRGAPILHWTIFNIGPEVVSLPAAMAPNAKPAGSQYGPNVRGSAQPYSGPRTPPGPAHAYHFQVFALDAAVGAEASANYLALTRAMNGHILASGELVGKGVVDPAAPPPAKP